MSIARSLQEYISGYDGMQLIDLSQIDTDYTHGKSGSWEANAALAPVGNSKTRTDVLGNKTYQNMYIFFAKDIAVDNSAREHMYDFLESFTNWIEDQIEEGNMPKLPGSFKATNLEASNHMLYDIEENGAGVYQVELILTIKKSKF